MIGRTALRSDRECETVGPDLKNSAWGEFLAGTSSRGLERRFAAEFLDEVRGEGVLGR